MLRDDDSVEEPSLSEYVGGSVSWVNRSCRNIHPYARRQYSKAEAHKQGMLRVKIRHDRLEFRAENVHRMGIMVQCEIRREVNDECTTA